MNQYKNKYGCHTPELTRLTMQALMASFPGIEWNDSSWHNDAADSITCKLKSKHELRVWLPNDEQELPEYGFMLSNKIEPYRDEQYKTLQEVIEQITKTLNDQKTMQNESEILKAKIEAFNKATKDLADTWEAVENEDLITLSGDNYPLGKQSVDEFANSVSNWTKSALLEIDQIEEGKKSLKFTFKGVAIRNMFRDETDRFDVNPLEYYFITRDKVEQLLKPAN